MKENININVSLEGTTTVLQLSGKLCADHISELIPELEKRLQDSPPDLVADLAELTKIDDRGIAVIATLREKALSRGGMFSLCNVDGEIEKALTYHNFDKYISSNKKPLQPKINIFSRLGSE